MVLRAVAGSGSEDSGSEGGADDDVRQRIARDGLAALAGQSRGVKRLREHSEEEDEDEEEEEANTSCSEDTEAKRAKLVRAHTRDVNYHIDYECPQDAFVRQPTRRTRPRSKGETIGDCLVYGDSITWGMRDDRFGRSKLTWPVFLKSRLMRVGFRLVQSNFPERTTVHEDRNPPDPFKWNTGTEPHDFNGLDHFGVVFSSHSPLWLIVMLGTHDLKTRIRLAALEKQRHDLELEELYEEENERSCAELPSDAASVGAPPRRDSEESPEQLLDALKPTNGESASSLSSSGNSSSATDGPGARRKEPTKVGFDATYVAENCAKIGLKAREMFTGHCHEGDLRIVLVVPPPVRLTEVSRSLGFDEESERIAADFPEAFRKVCRTNHFLYAYDAGIDMNESVDGIHLTKKQHARLADSIWEAMKPELPRQRRAPSRITFNESGLAFTRSDSPE